MRWLLPALPPRSERPALGAGTGSTELDPTPDARSRWVSRHQPAQTSAGRKPFWTGRIAMPGSQTADRDPRIPTTTIEIAKANTRAIATTFNEANEGVLKAIVAKVESSLAMSLSRLEPVGAERARIKLHSEWPGGVQAIVPSRRDFVVPVLALIPLPGRPLRISHGGKATVCRGRSAMIPNAAGAAAAACKAARPGPIRPQRSPLCRATTQERARLPALTRRRRAANQRPGSRRPGARGPMPWPGRSSSMLWRVVAAAAGGGSSRRSQMPEWRAKSTPPRPGQQRCGERGHDDDPRPAPVARDRRRRG